MTVQVGPEYALANQHRKAVNQVDRVLQRPDLPRDVILYAPFQIL